MKTQRMKKFLFICLSVAAALHLTVRAADENKKPAAKESVTSTNGVIPKSIFDETLGKDPFFPRRTVGAGGPKTATSDFRLSDFTLNGITPFGAKPSAVINGKTFEKGESREVAVPSGGRVLVQCVDIKPDSVSIKIENSPKTVELKMRPGF